MGVLKEDLIEALLKLSEVRAKEEETLTELKKEQKKKDEGDDQNDDTEIKEEGIKKEDNVAVKEDPDANSETNLNNDERRRR